MNFTVPSRKSIKKLFFLASAMLLLPVLTSCSKKPVLTSEAKFPPKAGPQSMYSIVVDKNLAATCNGENTYGRILTTENLITWVTDKAGDYKTAAIEFNQRATGRTERYVIQYGPSGPTLLFGTNRNLEADELAKLLKSQQKSCDTRINDIRNADFPVNGVSITQLSDGGFVGLVCSPPEYPSDVLLDLLERFSAEKEAKPTQAGVRESGIKLPPKALAHNGKYSVEPFSRDSDFACNYTKTWGTQTTKTDNIKWVTDPKSEFKATALEFQNLHTGKIDRFVIFNFDSDIPTLLYASDPDYYLNPKFTVSAMVRVIKDNKDKCQNNRSGPVAPDRSFKYLKELLQKDYFSDMPKF